MKIYIYLISFILNLCGLCKKNKGKSFYSSFIFSLNYLILGILANYIFGLYNLEFYNLEFILIVIFLSFLFSVYKSGYGCISYSFSICGLGSYIFDINVPYKEMIYLIGFLHIIEGISIVVICIKNMKLKVDYENKNLGSILNISYFLPLFINVSHSIVPFIFLIFFRRSRKKFVLQNNQVLSGVLNLIYGIILLISSFYIINNFIKIVLVIMVSVLHEMVFYIEDVVMKSCRNKFQF